MAEAETLLKQRGQAARMGGNMSADAKWLSSALRGDTTCWLHKEGMQERACMQLLALLSLLEGVRRQLLLQGWVLCPSPCAVRHAVHHMHTLQRCAMTT